MMMSCRHVCLFGVCWHTAGQACVGGCTGPMCVHAAQMSALVFARCLGNASVCLEGKEKFFSMPTKGRATGECYWLILTENSSLCFLEFVCCHHDSQSIGTGVGGWFAHRCINRMLHVQHFSLRIVKKQLKAWRDLLLFSALFTTWSFSRTDAPILESPWSSVFLSRSKRNCSSLVLLLMKFKETSSLKSYLFVHPPLCS